MQINILEYCPLSHNRVEIYCFFLYVDWIEFGHKFASTFLCKITVLFYTMYAPDILIQVGCNEGCGYNSALNCANGDWN